MIAIKAPSVARSPSMVVPRTALSSATPLRVVCRADPNDKAARDNRSTQLNPNNPNYQASLQGG